MLVQPFLGGTTFDAAQIVVEILLMVLLIIGVLSNKIKKEDATLLGMLFFFSFISFLLNEFNVFALNFKIFFLTILVISYFSKIDFFPHKSILFFLAINIFYAIYVKITGNYVLEELSILKQQGTYVGSRPIGFLGTPHATSTLIAMYFLYLINIGMHSMVQLMLLSVLFIYASWTALVALVAHLIFMFVDKITPFRINQVLFFSLFVFSVLTMGALLLDLMRNIPGSRYYSVEVILPMFFDVRFYEPLLTWYPQSHISLIESQEVMFAAIGNEFGIIKIFVEGGFVLSLFLMHRVIGCAKYMTVFLLVTTLHYSFFVNMPFIMFLFIVLNQNIDQKRNMVRALKKPWIQPITVQSMLNSDLHNSSQNR